MFSAKQEQSGRLTICRTSAAWTADGSSSHGPDWYTRGGSLWGSKCVLLSLRLTSDEEVLLGIPWFLLCCLIIRVCWLICVGSLQYEGSYILPWNVMSTFMLVPMVYILVGLPHRPAVLAEIYNTLRGV